MGEKIDKAELSFDERLDRIKEGRRLSYAEDSISLKDCMPRLHRDCYWLLSIVENLTEEQLDELREDVRADQIRVIEHDRDRIVAYLTSEDRIDEIAARELAARIKIEHIMKR